MDKQIIELQIKYAEAYDNAVIYGLRRKGYTFESDGERNQFFKDNIELRLEGKDMRFFVKGKPFLYIGAPKISREGGNINYNSEFIYL